MTATGFVLLALGILLVLGFGSELHAPSNGADHIGMACISIGFGLLLVGFAVFLWMAMP